MQRHQLLAAAGALALCSAASLPAFAQDAYPNKPIRLVVPFPPSGGTDVLSRAIAQAISTETSWNFVVDNRPGAGGNIGLEAAAKSPVGGLEALIERTIGYALCQGRRHDEATPHFEQSLELARRQRAEFEAALTLRAMAAVGWDGADGLREESNAILERLGVVSVPHVPLP